MGVKRMGLLVLVMSDAGASDTSEKIQRVCSNILPSSTQIMKLCTLQQWPTFNIILVHPMENMRWLLIHPAVAYKKPWKRSLPMVRLTVRSTQMRLSHMPRKCTRSQRQTSAITGMIMLLPRVGVSQQHSVHWLLFYAHSSMHYK